jgi:hypothetical protein
MKILGKIFATAQPCNKRKSFYRSQVSRNRSANSFNHSHNLSAVAGTRATIVQLPSTVGGDHGMTARVSSAIPTTNRRLCGLPESSHSLRQSSPELHQPLRGVNQPFLHAYQSLKEANQPSQDAQNQQFDAIPR